MVLLRIVHRKVLCGTKSDYSMAVVLNHIPGGPPTLHILHLSFVWPISGLGVSTNELMILFRCV